jgi:hypothetical protein
MPRRHKVYDGAMQRSKQSSGTADLFASKASNVNISFAVIPLEIESILVWAGRRGLAPADNASLVNTSQISSCPCFSSVLQSKTIRHFAYGGLLHC